MVKCPECESIVKLEKPKNSRKRAIVYALIFGVVSGIFGLSVGIATAGVGFVLSPFIVPVALYAGYKTGKYYSLKSNGATCPECSSEFN